MTEGSLQIRGAAESAELPAGTAITGTNTDGALTAGTLTVPAISFVFAVTNPATTTVDVEARFGLVTPNSLTGSIDPDRMVRATARLKVDLTLRVALIPNEVYNCSASPVVLVLEGHHDGEQVRLVDEDFAVPAMPITSNCPDFIADGINTQLQGPGHSLSLAMEGALTAPLHPGEATTTSLAVSPASASALGDEVTLTATVAPGPDADNTDAPEGLVAFKDGSTTLDTVSLEPDGTATLTTTVLAAGPRRLSAHYLGSPPVYAGSSSVVVHHRVSAPPIVSLDLPAAAVINADAVPISVDVTNSAYGVDVPASRLEVILQRAGGAAALGPVGVTPRIVLERVDGDLASPVTLTSIGNATSQRLTGVIDDNTEPLLAGQSRQVRLRMTTSAALGAGDLRVTVALVDTPTDDTLTSGARTIRLLAAERTSPTILAGRTAVFPGLPDFPPIMPVRARAGSTIQIRDLRLSPLIDNRLPTGVFTFSASGHQLLARDNQVSLDVDWHQQFTFSGIASANVDIVIPSTVPAGPLAVTVSFAGDDFYRPSAATLNVTIEPAIGPSYDCVLRGPVGRWFRGQLEARAALPNAAVPSDVSLAGPLLRFHFPRVGDVEAAFLNEAVAAADRSVRVDLTGGGEATSTGITFSNSAGMTVDEPTAVDRTLRLDGLSGFARYDGYPGDLVGIAVERFVMEFINNSGYTTSLTCTPVGSAKSLGQTHIAGTVLDAPTAVAAGAEATLTAAGYPSGPGVIEFRADGQTVGLAATQDGLPRSPPSTSPRATRR